MPDGGELSVTTAPVKLDADPSTGHGPQSCAQLIVTDTGFGIDEQTLAQIFDPFFTTKPVGKGTGLGLSTAMATIKQAGGRLDVTSATGHGTTFTISLPRSDHAATTIPGDQPTTSLDAQRILLVDDNDSLRRLFASTLRTDGYDITEARDADQAAQQLASSRFDLLITDHVLPGSDRQPPARVAAIRHPHMPILQMSGYPQTPDSMPETEAPTAFILKPFTADQLAQHVRDLLAQALTSL
jgi:CheY-like chemotaxis protein